MLFMKILVYILVLVLAFPFVFAANECDSFCTDKSYDYGVCRSTVDEGFCNGNSEEDVYSFSPCTDFKRCCCGYGSETVPSNESVSNSSVGENTSSDIVPVLSSESKGVSKTAFWILLVLVVLLGLAVWWQKGFSDSGKEDKEEKKEHTKQEHKEADHHDHGKEVHVHEDEEMSEEDMDEDDSKER